MLALGAGTLDEVRALRAEIGDRNVDIIVEGTMSEHSPAAYADAGATWWIESMWHAMAEHSPVTAAYDRLRTELVLHLQGPEEIRA